MQPDLVITSDGVTAAVSVQGARLRSLRAAGRDLVVPSDGREPASLFRGVIAAPWPNRIGDGRYAFDGIDHRLPINEPERRTALHGLVMAAPWRLIDRSGTEVVLGHRLRRPVGYPFDLEFVATYEVTASGLALALTTTNVGDQAAPYGCTFHPYLRAGNGHVDHWNLELPAAAYLATDVRGLPVEIRPVEGSDYDFRSERELRALVVDHAFTDLTDTRARLLASAEGVGVEIEWDGKCPWLQVYTADQPGTPHHRTGVAIEPMTCPPDAFRTGTDVVVLAPGDRHSAHWSIRPLA